jgi:hypothetical protein
MDWFDQPAGQPASFTPPPTAEPPARPAAPSPVLSGTKRLIATTILAVGLLGVGGAAVVFAADPATSPAPSAATTPDGSGGTGGTTTPGTRPQRQGTPGQGHVKGDCPNMDGAAGSGGSGSGASGGTTAPSTAPSTNGSTSTPSQSDL